MQEEKREPLFGTALETAHGPDAAPVVSDADMGGAPAGETVEPGRGWGAYFPNIAPFEGSSRPGTVAFLRAVPDSVPRFRRFPTYDLPHITPMDDTEYEPPRMHPADEAEIIPDDAFDPELVAGLQAFQAAVAAEIDTNKIRNFDADGNRIAFPSDEQTARSLMNLLIDGALNQLGRDPSSKYPMFVVPVPIPEFDSDAVTLVDKNDDVIKYVYGITWVPTSLIRTYGMAAVIHAALYKAPAQAFVTFLRAEAAASPAAGAATETAHLL